MPRARLGVEPNEARSVGGFRVLGSACEVLNGAGSRIAIDHIAFCCGSCGQTYMTYSVQHVFPWVF